MNKLLSLYNVTLCFQGRLFGTGQPVGVLFPKEDHLSDSKLYSINCL